MTSINRKFINGVIVDAMRYSNRFECDLDVALADWEGNGPEGGFGLRRDEMDAVVAELRNRGYELHQVATQADAKRALQTEMGTSS